MTEDEQVIKKNDRCLLIVEDDKIIASALQLLFERRGCTVHAAATLSQAEGQLSPDIDWVVTDILLPDGDGQSFIARVIEDFPETKVIVVTGIRDTHRIESLRKLNIESFLIKPVSFSDLLSVIDGTNPNR